MSSLEALESRIVTLTTDFGYKDPFVGQMKGVILSIFRDAKIVDITHDIESHSIEEGAFVLHQSYRYFPQGTIHIAVVDPGVGSERRALAVEAQGHIFLCPDNGILSLILSQGSFRAFKIENSSYILKPKSPTFQGRDLFASAAGWILNGVRLEDLGEPVEDPVLLSIEEPKRILDPETHEVKIIGKIVYIDKFGNLITNIRAENLKVKRVRVRNLELPFVSYYSQAKDLPSALVNSDGLIEIFQFRGSAKNALSIGKHETVEVLADG